MNLRTADPRENNARTPYAKTAIYKGLPRERARRNPAKNGEKQFVVLPYEEFLAIQELLNDANDLTELRAAKRSESQKKSIPLAKAKAKLGLR